MVAKVRPPHTFDRSVGRLTLFRSIETQQKIIGWQFRGESPFYLADCFDHREEIEALSLLAERVMVERNEIKTRSEFPRPCSSSASDSGNLSELGPM